MIERLGVDVWGTIRSMKSYEGEMIPGAFSALKQLVIKRFGKSVWIVSADQTGGETLHWFKEQNFYEETGIIPEHVRFCRIWQKVSLYDKLGITHVIDDNDFILTHIDAARHRYLFKTEYSLGFMMSKESLLLEGTKIQVVTNWEQVLNILLSKEAE